MLEKNKKRWRFIVYFLPLVFVILLFPRTKIQIAKLPYPQKIEWNGKDPPKIERGFSEMPKFVPIDPKVPLLALLPLPREIFAYNFCLGHKNYYLVNGEEMLTDFDKLEVKLLRKDKQDFRLPSNSKACGLIDDVSGYYIGDVVTDPNPAVEIMKKNKLNQIEGNIEVTLSLETQRSFLTIFVASLINAYIAWWGILLLWRNMHAKIFEKHEASATAKV